MIARDDTLAKGDLYRLALTSPQWRDIAENVLWQCMEGILPVLSPVPDLCSKVDLIATRELSRAIKAEDWVSESVLRRRALVTELVMPCEHWWDVQEAVAACPPLDKLFPNLRRFTIVARSPYDNRGIHPGVLDVIISPTVTTLHLVNVRTAHIADPNALLIRCRELVDIRVDHKPEPLDEPYGDGFAILVIEAVQQYEDLTSLDLSLHACFDGYDLEVLAEMPGLHSLALRCIRPWERPDDIPPPPQLDRESFHALRKLELHDFIYQDVLAVIQSVPDRPLQSIRLTVAMASSQSLTNLTEAIGKYCNTSTLQTIGISVKYKNNAVWSLYLVHLQPLSVFVRVRHIILQHVCTPTLADKDVVKLAEWWPELRRLVLTKVWGLSSVARLTLGALVPIAERCPDIERVVLPINALEVPGSGPMVQSRTRSTFTLDVGEAAIADAVAVAQFIGHIFPSIREVEHEREYPWQAAGGRGMKWKRVNEVLRARQSAAD